jgi:hypothetical protein
MLLQEGISNGLFWSEYPMSPESFQKLVNLVQDDLEPKETKVMMTLCWLAGGQYVDHSVNKME